MQHKDRSNLKYLNWLMRLNCYRDLVPFFLNCGRPAKEITESMGMYVALRKMFNEGDFKKPRNIICIGDGKTPRTAALIAHLTKWRAYSIDPLMELNRFDATNLNLFKCKIENIKRGVLPSGAVVLSPHGHFKMREAVELLRPSHVITMPCCHFAQQTLDIDPLFDYHDHYVLTEQNRIIGYEL